MVVRRGQVREDLRRMINHDPLVRVLLAPVLVDQDYDLIPEEVEIPEEISNTERQAVTGNLRRVPK